MGRTCPGIMEVAIAGWSGLVGTELLKLLEADPKISKVRCLGRSTAEGHGDKVIFHQVDFDSITLNDMNLDQAFCCLGTTIKKAGSQEAFRKVDHDYVISFAKWAKQRACSSFHVVSALGVKKDSPIFYNRVKAEMEYDLAQLDMKCLRIYRPALLMGDRSEFRFGEKVAILIMKVIGPLFVGPLKKYKGIHVRQVARAMHAGIASNQSKVVQSDEMQAFSAK